MSDINTRFWELLNLSEDLIRGGIRREHEAPPDRLEIPGRRASRERGDAESYASRGEALARIAAEIGACKDCRLCTGRTNTVPGEGELDPLVMVIGEGPGADEDRTGRPFVGRAGQYLDKWLAAIQLSREKNAFIGNVVKCRPPGNRDPQPDESFACRPFLDRQIELIRPAAILTVGRIAAQQLLATETGIGRLRGNTFEYHGIPLIPTYHPSGVLRNPELRQAVWDDLRRLRALLDENGR